MDFSKNENPINILQHSIVGLAEKGLIAQDYHYGDVQYIRSFFSQANAGGFIIEPTVLGAEFFY